MFLNFLHEVGVTVADYSEAIPQGVPKRHKIKYGFSNEETTAILGAVNRNTIIGKRDYAMMLIAARTGLRAVDIANLKYQDIDWRLKEIRIVQQKTGVPLTLPLSSEVGNAIAEYILNARPKADVPQIFLNFYRPHDPVKPETVGMAVTKYTSRVGAVNPITPNRRAHAFRRGFAMNLLDASVSNDMLIEMLGQVEPNSSKAYLPIDENGLKNCAISLASVRREVCNVV
jgi:integrase